MRLHRHLAHKQACHALQEQRTQPILAQFDCMQKSIQQRSSAAAQLGGRAIKRILVFPLLTIPASESLDAIR